jgi:hypothetical protein
MKNAKGKMQGGEWGEQAGDGVLRIRNGGLQSPFHCLHFALCIFHFAFPPCDATTIILLP